jgi:undecaprenyl phosphate N,N'-diacetylbacillosamine 1-phosphate transferase
MIKARAVRNLNLFIKRLIDFFGGLIGAIIISPILIIIAFAIKLTSKGPVLFKQKRLGKDGKVFKIIKFRTMVVNAENIGDGLRVSNENDVRITRVGKFLRATSLDELPQLWNVVIGDMSLVGPRPPVPYHPYNGCENYPDWSKLRFKMRPGMTGLSQVSVRASVSWDERMIYDVEYVDRFNIYLDSKILLRTIKKVFMSDSIYLHTEKNVLANRKR